MIFKCTECGGKCSSDAKCCPHCGFDLGNIVFELSFSYKYDPYNPKLKLPDKKIQVFNCVCQEYFAGHTINPIFSMYLFNGFKISNLHKRQYLLWLIVFLSIVFHVIYLGFFATVAPKDPINVFFWIFILLPLSIGMIGHFYCKIENKGRENANEYYAKRIADFFSWLSHNNKLLLYFSKPFPIVGKTLDWNSDMPKIMFLYFNETDKNDKLAQLKSEMFCYFFKGSVEFVYDPDKSGRATLTYVP